MYHKWLLTNYFILFNVMFWIQHLLKVFCDPQKYADDFERFQFTSELNTKQHINGAWAELGKKKVLRNSCDNISDKARLGG